MPRPLPGPDSNPSPLAARQQAQRAIGQIGHDIKAVSRAVAPPVPRALRTGANPRGVAIQAPTGGKTLAQAVRDVFAHQDPKRQAAIVHGVIMGRTDPATNQAVTEAFHALDPRRQMEITKYFPVTASHLDIGKFLHNANPFSAGNFAPSGGASAGVGPGTPRGAAAIGGKAYENLKLAGTLAKNTGRDAIDLPAESLASVGTIGGDLVGGHLSKALSDVITPYEQFLKNPGAVTKKDPLYTYLMMTGLLHGATRVAAGGVRAFAPRSAAGQALDTTRESVQLHGQLTHERPRESPYPLIQASQKGFERGRYQRGPTGALEPRSSRVRDRLTALAISRLVGINERIRGANRDATIVQRAQAVRPTLAQRLAHGVKTSVRYDPEQSTIPGAGVLARIADGTIRRPDTFRGDILKHLGKVARNRVNLLSDDGRLTRLGHEHDAYVKALKQAADQTHTPAQLKALFDAAEEYHKDYVPVQGAAKRFGQFGSRPDAALLRRTLMHYAVSHMEATYDGKRGLVDEHGNPLSNDAIIEHIKGPEGLGGRMPTFTSDKPKRGSAFYISNERRPLPEGAKNTLFSYTHGLTDPSHHALLEQHVRMQGIVDAHRGQNRMVDAITIVKEDGKAYKSFTDAQNHAPPGYRPIALSQPFHPLDSLDKALEGTSPHTIDEEAAMQGLDLEGRLTDRGQGRWGLAPEAAITRLREHQSVISSNAAWRGFKMTNNAFRRIALGTSAKHIPGIITESVLRDIASGIGIPSWIVGRRLVKNAKRLDPVLGNDAKVSLTGGTVSGQTLALATRQTSEHFRNTALYRPLRTFEQLMRAPGPRQMRGAWRAWSDFAIGATKHFIEEQHQIAGLGHVALQDFGAEHGQFAKTLRLQGELLDDASRGLFDQRKLRAFRAGIENLYGHWNDLTPHGQTLLMFSPFGMWWLNSVRWLARSPIDRPVGTGVLAAAASGTQKERRGRGLDMFAPGALPPYMQGSIPLAGNGLLAQNYYSPYGVANDPLASISLIEPWVTSIAAGFVGDNYAGRPLTSPNNPYGDKQTNAGQRAAYILNSALGLFVPFYSKAQMIAQGGASAYDSSTALSPQTKTPGKGLVAGAEKAFSPLRVYHDDRQGSGGGSSGSSGLGGSGLSDSTGLGGGSGLSGGSGL